MKHFFQAVGVITFWVAWSFPIQAEPLSDYEQELSDHFLAHVEFLVDRRSIHEMSEAEQATILASQARFEAALSENGLYAAHLVWLSDPGITISQREPAEGWDGVSRLTEGQYQDILNLLDAARGRTLASGEMMTDGRKTVHDYFFRPLQDRRLDYSLLQVDALMTKDYEHLQARTGDWMKMIGWQDLLALNPPVMSIVQADEAERRADENIAEAKREADEAERNLQEIRSALGIGG